MISKREALAWSATVVTLAALWIASIQPAPYRDVRDVVVTTEESLTHFTANFEKTACEFRRLEVVGNLAGVNEFLYWFDPTKDRQRDVDRTKGEHTLTLTISGTVKKYDWIEIRTRHFCPDKDGPDVENTTNGLYVDGVFYRITKRDLTTTPSLK
mgnify:CR=1 FL=1